jgi:hypothetical protein
VICAASKDKEIAFFQASCYNRTHQGTNYPQCLAGMMLSVQKAEYKEYAVKISPRHRDLVLLFPQFLMVRHHGWTGLPHWLQTSGLELPILILLRDLVWETDPEEALSRQEIESRLFNPYSTFNPIFDNLPLLVEKGYLFYADTGYLVTPRGRTLIEQVEQDTRNHIATRTPLPLPELTFLANRLEEIAQRMWQADEPTVKAHQARCHRFPPITTDAPMVHLEAAVFALWMARDDAHMAAWRAKGFSGPHLDLLTRVWTREAQTLPALTTALQDSQRADDIAQGIRTLSEAGYVLVEGEGIRITEVGQRIRDWIEEETDRLYFTPWPDLLPEELDRVYTLLKAVCDAL